MSLRALLLSTLLLAWSPTALCKDVSLGDIVRNLTADAADDTRHSECQEITKTLSLLQNQLSALQDHLNTSQSRSGECPSGWSRHSTGCYLIPAVTSTWFGATAACPAIDRRARLASVNLANHQFVEDLVAGSGDAFYVWVGGVQLRKGGDEWVWQDGTALDYTNWAPRQPDPTQDHCVCLQAPRSDYGAKVGQWHNGSSCILPSFNFLCHITLG